nr:hypothetical protein [Tanacetum cinerariifolium]
MEEFVTKDRANYYSRITSITVNGKVVYDLKGKFLDDLRHNAFSGTNGEDAVEHIEYFLKIVDHIDLANVYYERLRLVFFPILKYYPPSHTCNVMGTETKKDSTNNMFKEWLAYKFANHMMMDPFTREVLRDFWKKVDNKEGVTNKGFYNLEEANNNDEHEIPEIFRIETNLFDYETPLCIEFKEFNYLLKFQDYWWKVNDDECSPFTNWRDHIRGPYSNYYSIVQDEEEQEDKERCELFDDPAQESIICKIKRFEMIKYSFGQEYEHDDLTRTNEDACHAYQEIFHNIDEGWLVTRAK